MNSRGYGMKRDSLLISFASWEDRFRLGFNRNLKTGGVGKALIFYFESYATRTHENLGTIEKTCKDNGTTYTPLELQADDPADNWRKIIDTIEGIIQNDQEVLIDISTMPREVIWYVLWLLEQKSITTRYVYHSPRAYGDDWLSREPRTPRLVYKLSGEALPAAKTALLATVGFDLQRVKRLISWCEPARIMIGVQVESQFRRNNETMGDYRETLQKEYDKEYDCDIFELDAYAEDRGMKAIQEALERLDSSYNVIMSSLGPKLTAVTLFKLQRQRPERGLVYAPSNQFNENYSSGIGQCFEGVL